MFFGETTKRQTTILPQPAPRVRGEIVDKILEQRIEELEKREAELEKAV